MSGTLSGQTNMDGTASIDRTADFLEVTDTTGPTTYKATPNFILGITGNPVGTSDSQTLTNKTLTSPAISSPTLSGTVAGTYTLGGTPTFPSSVVTLTGTQILTNKTLTSPTIATPTITNPTLSVDTISEFTGANGVTIDGVLLKDSKINGSYITNDSVTGAQINWAGTGADSGIWWEELGRTTLGVAGDTISVTSLSARKYLKIVIFVTATGGTINATLRCNNDSGANYANRSSANGAADGTGVSATSMGLSATASTNSKFIEAQIINVLAFEKLLTGHCIESDNAGATGAAARAELANKWANTSAQISRIDIINTGAGDFAIGSECAVLGHN